MMSDTDSEYFDTYSESEIENYKKPKKLKNHSYSKFVHTNTETMDNQEFNSLYDPLRNLPQNVAGYNNIQKKDVLPKLISALKCLEVASLLISKQNDTLMATTNELREQCMLTRTALSQPQKAELPVPSDTAENKAPRTFADTVKASHVIVVKPTGDAAQMNPEELKKKAETALKKIKVSNARINDRGSLVVEVPSPAEHSTATENLKSAFSNNFTIENPKKILPKLTVTNVPNEYTEDNLISSICERDTYLEEMVKSGEEMSVIKMWSNNGEVRSKKFAMKCSPTIREYIMNKNGGYVYLNMFRSKVYDRFSVIQCYHCQSFNHIASKCADKDKSPVCCKCSGPHKIIECNSTHEKCNNCAKSKLRGSHSHRSNSTDCPIYAREREFLIKKTDYSLKKN